MRDIWIFNFLNYLSQIHSIFDLEYEEVNLGDHFQNWHMVARGRYQQEKSKQIFKTAVVLLAPLPQGLHGGLLFGIFM